MTTAAEIRSFILDSVADPLAAVGQTPETVDDGFDLLAEAVIDSFGLLELILQLESRLGVAVDFEGIEADDLTRVGPLSRYLAAQAAR